MPNLKENLERDKHDFIEGGSGSGNFGHAGRPGERGGSASGGPGFTRTKGGDTYPGRTVTHVAPKGDTSTGKYKGSHEGGALKGGDFGPHIGGDMPNSSADAIKGISDKQAQNDALVQAAIGHSQSAGAEYNALLNANGLTSKTDDGTAGEDPWVMGHGVAAAGFAGDAIDHAETNGLDGDAVANKLASNKDVIDAVAGGSDEGLAGARGHLGDGKWLKDTLSGLDAYNGDKSWKADSYDKTNYNG